jgi:hypothetical protein
MVEEETGGNAADAAGDEEDAEFVPAGDEDGEDEPAGVSPSGHHDSAPPEANTRSQAA